MGKNISRHMCGVWKEEATCVYVLPPPNPTHVCKDATQCGLRVCVGLVVDLTEDGLVLALGAEVAGEALAEARAVVADAAAGAVAALRVAVALEHVDARRALLERAVRSAVAEVAHAAHVLHGIPRGRVGLGGISSELLLGVAEAVVGAVAGAHGALARDTIVVVEAVALAGLAVARSLVGALDRRVGLVGDGGDGDPGGGLGAGAERAIVGGPGGVAVRAEVAGALVVGAARAVAGAAVGAVGRAHGDERGEGDEEEGARSHCDE